MQPVDRPPHHPHDAPRPHQKQSQLKSFLNIGLPMMTFLLAATYMLSQVSLPWLRKMDKLQGRSEADFPKARKEEPGVPTVVAPPKRMFDLEEEWKVSLSRSGLVLADPGACRKCSRSSTSITGSTSASRGRRREVGVV